MNQEQWARELLSRMGYSTSKSNVTAIMAWMRAEGGNWNNTAKYNPLNTTQRMSGSHSMNSVGVQAYSSWDQGFDATIKTLRNGYYKGILSALSSGKSANAVASAVTSSPWGTKHISVGGITITGSTLSSSGVDGSVAKDSKATAEDYGFTLALLNANPELKKIFAKATKGGWSAEKFQAEIRDTKWWKSHSQQERDYLVKRYGDPASAKQEYSQARIHVQQLAGTLGIQASDQTKARLDAWAYNVAAKGWSDDQLRFEMGKYVFFDGDTWNGQGGEVQAKLHDYAYSMGVTMSSKWYADGARAIVRGTGSEQMYQSIIRKTAKALFPQWSKQIDGGQTVADLANPYLTTMTQILELPGGSVNLFDGTIKKALNYKDPATGNSIVKPLWQFENELRSDPRWKSTQNAQNSLMQVAHQVLSDFGLKF